MNTYLLLLPKIQATAFLLGTMALIIYMYETFGRKPTLIKTIAGYFLVINVVIVVVGILVEIWTS